MAFKELLNDQLRCFLDKAFPKSDGFSQLEGHGLVSKNSFVFTLPADYPESRSEIFNKVAHAKFAKEFPKITNIEYKPNAANSSVGRLEITYENHVYKVYLKPNVKISNNFNAMLTELLPLAMLRANTSILLSEVDGVTSIYDSISDQIEYILIKIQNKPEKEVHNLIDQLDQNIQYVFAKADEIKAIYNFYLYHIRKKDWNVSGFREYKWLGYDKVVKNDNYTDRADVQITNDCRISLKSVMPTPTPQKIFLCNTTFNAFFRDIEVLTGIEAPRREEFPKYGTYGKLLSSYLKEVLKGKAHYVLHYILGDYRKDLNSLGKGYNHIVLSSNRKVVELGLNSSDNFIAAAMDENLNKADLVVKSGNYAISYEKDEKPGQVDISFKDRPIKPDDRSWSLKFKILEQIQ
jgi:hypothetical protein